MKDKIMSTKLEIFEKEIIILQDKIINLKTALKCLVEITILNSDEQNNEVKSAWFSLEFNIRYYIHAKEEYANILPSTDRLEKLLKEELEEKSILLIVYNKKLEQIKDIINE